MFLKAYCAPQGCTYLNSNIITSKITVFYYNTFLNVIYCDGKGEFSASLLKSSVSHDPSEISLICSRNISYYQCWL